MKLSRRLLIIVIIAVVIAALAVGAVLKLTMKPHKVPPPTAAQLQAWQYPVTAITTNLEGTSIIQIQLTLQTMNVKVVAELTARSAQVDDSVISVLHGMSSQELFALNGRMILKKKLIHLINSYLTSGKITAVYIQSLIVQ